MPNGNTSLNVYYTASRNRMVDVETFTFPTKKLRDEMVAKLDGMFL